MRPHDLDAVAAISDAVHDGAYSERRAIYAERLALYPAGCHVCAIEGEPAGYLIAHPWHRDAPPALDAPLGTLPVDAGTYYLHDIALLAPARGGGRGAAALGLAIRDARTAGFAEISLVAVGGADGYWDRQGFRPVAPYPAYGPEAVLMRLDV